MALSSAMGPEWSLFRGGEGEGLVDDDFGRAFFADFSFVLLLVLAEEKPLYRRVRISMMENWLKGIVGILLSCFRVGCSDNCFRVGCSDILFSCGLQ